MEIIANKGDCSYCGIPSGPNQLIKCDCDKCHSRHPADTDKPTCIDCYKTTHTQAKRKVKTTSAILHSLSFTSMYTTVASTSTPADINLDQSTP